MALEAPFPELDELLLVIGEAGRRLCDGERGRTGRHAVHVAAPAGLTGHVRARPVGGQVCWRRFMENECDWHGRAPDDEQYARAIRELEQTIGCAQRKKEEDMPLEGYVEYQRREFCKSVPCPVQVLLDAETEGTARHEQIRRLCKTDCIHTTYEFHHWLIQKGYLIIRPEN